ncbi:hypothetical protein PsYK624_137590 [Phanerochaete sordida]|uniref:Uncharacterized protein n=1 Tax=Phanerochaete sordida TaxID=48140 RepID=A0A9P3GM91_9APHY|nr:hypothetical protein PsYK624_137590 [Phanerochaete sordida]
MRTTRTKDEGPPSPKRPGMGPVFAPSKQASKQTGAASPMHRTACVHSSVSSPSRTDRPAAATPTLRPVQPSVQPSPAPSSVAIQELQRAQGGRGKKKMRSLMDIQAEEAARRVEEEFLEWWAAEEVRLRPCAMRRARLLHRSSSRTRRGGRRGGGIDFDILP